MRNNRVKNHSLILWLQSTFNCFILDGPQIDLVKLENDVKENAKETALNRKLLKIYTDKIDNIQEDIIELQKAVDMIKIKGNC